MILTYKYRLRPTAKQYASLDKILDSQRYLYNEALSWRQFAWDVYKTQIGLYDQYRWLTYLRKTDSTLPANLQRATLLRVHRAFASFFRRAKIGKNPGFPRFRSKGSFNSFGFSGWSGIRLVGKKIFFKGIQGGIRIHLHRDIPPGARFLCCTIKKDSKGWELSIQLEIQAAPPRGSRDNAIGVDVGLSSLVTLSNGEKIGNPRYFQKDEKLVRVIKRKLSRCSRYSKRRQRVKKTLGSTTAKIKNRRSTYLHQVSRGLVNRFDFIAIEKLCIAGMVQGDFGKSIHDASWGYLFHMLKYKAECAGTAVAVVDPKNTSQECSCCHEIVLKDLSVRIHSCSHCGLILDRDVNAARNILHRAVVGPAGHNVVDYHMRATENVT